MKSKTILIIIGIATIVVGLLIVGPAIGFHNAEVRLRNGVEAQQKANEATFDRVWKVLSQQAQVAEQHKDAFKEIYTDIMSDSAGGNSRLLAFVQSVNPTFDQSSFTNLQASIESNRRDFEREQKSLIQKWTAHRDHIQTFPNSVYAGIFGRGEIDITVVTSNRTKRTFETGQENEEDLDLFNSDG